MNSKTADIHMAAFSKVKVSDALTGSKREPIQQEDVLL